MLILNNHIYLHFQDFLTAGIGEDTVKRGLIRYRSGGKSWECIEHPEDARMVLVKYDTIPQATQDKLVEHYGDVWVYYRRGKLLNELEVNPKDTSYFMNTGFYQEKAAQDMAKLAAWMRLLGGIKGTRIAVDGYGFKTKGSLLAFAHAHILNEGLKVPNNFRNFRKKIGEFKIKGIKSLVSGKYGNKNTCKLTQFAKRLLMRLYSMHNKFDMVAVYEKYKQAGSRQGWKVASLATVKRYLRLPSVQMACDIERNGYNYFRKTYELTIHRHRPSYPHAMWVMDGTPLELYYTDGKSYRKRLYMFMVIDACTWNIVGYALGNTENEALVFQALKAACISSAYVPDQLQYDHSSAIMSNDMQAWYKEFCTYAFPAEVGNARAKVVEPLQGQFQQKILKEFPNHSGGNITAKRVDTLPNQEWLNKNKDSIPTREGVERQAAIAVQMWNKQHPIEAESNAKALTLELRCSLFWKWRMRGENKVTYKYTKDGLSITKAGQKYTYLVYDGKKADYAFWEEHAGKSFEVKYDSEDMSMICLYENGKMVHFAETVHKHPMAMVDRKEGDEERLWGEIQNRKEFRKRKKAESKAINEDELLEDLIKSVMIDAEGYAKAPEPENGKYKNLINENEDIIKGDNSLYFTEGTGKVVGEI